MSENSTGAAELSGVIAAAELVAFQPGTVVSRTIVKKSAGTVTAFAFDRDEGLSEHTAPFDALVLGLAGEADVTISGVAHRVGAGDLLQLPAGQPHSLKAVAPFKMMLIMIRA